MTLAVRPTAQLAAQTAAQTASELEALVDAWFGPGGTLAEVLSGFEARAGQRDLAQYIAHNLDRGGTLFAEAGTGTGKTLAYLVPALMSGKRVVVSTGTRALQDQLWDKDLPAVRARFPDAKISVLKGVSNYACLRKAARAGSNAPSEWLAITETGDLSELADPAARKLLATTSELRLGSQCPHADMCFVSRARRRAETSHIILTNHSLYFADLALRSSVPGARVLPSHDAVIFDEGHLLEGIAIEHFGTSLTEAGMLRVADDVAAVRTADMATIHRLADSLRHHLHGFWQLTRIRLAPLAEGDARFSVPDDAFATPELQSAWFAVDERLDDLCRLYAHEQEGDEHRSVLVIMRKCEAMRRKLATLVEATGSDTVRWAELSRSSAKLGASPVRVPRGAMDDVFAHTHSSVFVSATLSVNESFDYTIRGLSIDPETVDTVMVDGPFDFATQTIAYLASDIPDPRTHGWMDAIVARIIDLTAITNGRSLILCPSRRDATTIAKRLVAASPYPVISQARGDREALEQFCAQTDSILVGTGALWQGIDVPGDSLSQLIVTKLPFAPPDDPLIAARCYAAESESKSGFESVMLPESVLRFRQGIGRLIRRTSDRGIISVLDSRVVRKRYGRAFASALPSNAPRTSSLERVRRWWSDD